LHKLLRITDLYPQYIQSVYEKNADLSSQSFLEQSKKLSSKSVEISSSYVKELNAIGVESFELISNANIAQKQWLKENDLPQNLSFQETIIKQIENFKPDVVWIDTTSLLNDSFINNLRRLNTTIKKIVGHICAPFNSNIEKGLKELDAVFTCTPCIEHELKSKGMKIVTLIYHAFYPEIINWVKEENNPYSETDFVFTGSLYTGYGLHKSRIEYIETMIANQINVSIYGNLESRNTVFKKQAMYYAINSLNKIGAGSIINKTPTLSRFKNYGEEKINYYSSSLINATKPPVFGLEMYKVLANSKICFNIHGEIAKKCAGNIRLFEATGIGTCLITDHKDNMKDLFEVGKEVVTYTNLNDCLEKVKWLINNPSERIKIAKSGQERVLKSHTVKNRVEQINSVICNLLK
jgi:spore maturation protein CgeB